MIKSIMDRNFWYDLEDLIEILKPLYNSYVMSKSENANLDYIIIE